MKTDIFLTAAQVAGLTGIDVSCLRSQAKTNSAVLGFPVTIVGNRVRFPTKPFCEFTGISEDELQTLLSNASSAQEAANA